MFSEVAKAVWKRRNEFFWFGMGLILMRFIQNVPGWDPLVWAAYLIGIVLLVTVLAETIAVIRKRRSGKP